MVKLTVVKLKLKFLEISFLNIPKLMYAIKNLVRWPIWTWLNLKKMNKLNMRI